MSANDGRIQGHALEDPADVNRCPPSPDNQRSRCYSRNETTGFNRRMLRVPIIRIDDKNTDFNAKINSVEYRKTDSKLKVICIIGS